MLQIKDPPRNRAAWERFLQLGLPTKQQEVYRYVHLKELYHPSYNLPQTEEKEATKESHRLLFVNGEFRPESSHSPSSLIALPLSQAVKTYGSYLNLRMQKQLKEETDPFVLLNGAYFKEGLFLYLPPKTVLKEPLTILHLLDELQEPTLCCPRIYLFVGKGASLHLSFVQRGSSGIHFINSVVECLLEEEAEATFISLSQPHAQTHDFLAVRANLKEGSQFTSFDITKGCSTSRRDYELRLQGEGAHASLYGGWNLDEARQHHINILMDHQQPHCTSLQKFKGVVRGTARSSFEGKIYVHSRAQKTEAYQMNNNLILSEGAVAYSKPNLEIFADDVKASHGSTTGRLEEEQLFYLQARGIPQTVARDLLVQAFLQELIDLIQFPAVREEAMKLLDLLS